MGRFLKFEGICNFGNTISQKYKGLKVNGKDLKAL